MRKMMMVASLVSAAACGSVTEPGMTNDDMGSGSAAGSDVASGSGSGSGSADAGVPEANGQLTIDSSDFVIDGGVWWTSTSGPTLHGTFDAPAGASVQLKLGEQSFPATLTGNLWAVSLPANTIATSSAPIVVVLSVAGGSDVQLSRTLGLDTAPPAIGAQTSMIRDERGDTIDFSTGEPVHTHAGATIDLGAGSCPSVYKYAYLMDASPTFGSATSPNDLAWKIRVSDAKLEEGSQQFRVRSDAGAVLIAWTALPAPDAAGYSRVKLTRNGGAYPIAALGTRTGQFFIDVRATDWAGLSTTQSFCFDNHPLAAPLEVSHIETSDLFDTTMNDDAEMNRILGGGAASVTKQRFVQQTAEPVVVAWSTTATAPTYSAIKMAGYVEETFSANWMCQAGTTDPRCAMSTTPNKAYLSAHENTVTGTMTSRFSAQLRDEVSGQVIQTSTAPSMSFTIPARAPNEAPHPYTVEVMQFGFYELAPEQGWAWTYLGVNTLMGSTYTGYPAVDLQGTQCVTMMQTAFGPMCSAANKYWTFTALDSATVTYAPFVATITTGIDAQQQVAPAYIPASSLTSEAFVWNTGDDDLPGAF